MPPTTRWSLIEGSSAPGTWQDSCRHRSLVKGDILPLVYLVTFYFECFWTSICHFKMYFWFVDSPYGKPESIHLAESLLIRQCGDVVSQTLERVIDALHSSSLSHVGCCSLLNLQRFIGWTGMTRPFLMLHSNCEEIWKWLKFLCSSHSWLQSSQSDQFLTLWCDICKKISDPECDNTLLSFFAKIFFGELL